MSEYWITRDDTIYCDGDASVDTPNHEAVVRKHCFDIVHAAMQESNNAAVNRVASGLNCLLEDNVLDAPMLRMIINDTADELVYDKLAMEEEVDDIYSFIFKHIHLEHEWMFDAMCDRDIGDLRVYGVEKLGWHRIQGDSIQTANVSSRNLREITEGLYSVFLDGYGQDPATMSFDIEAAGVFFTGVPFHAIAAANVTGLARYRNRVAGMA